MDDDLYRRLLEYAADQSKIKVKRLSIGEAVRGLVTVQLTKVGYEAPRGALSQHARPVDESLYLRRTPT